MAKNRIESDEEDEMEEDTESMLITLKKNVLLLNELNEENKNDISETDSLYVESPKTSRKQLSEKVLATTSAPINRNKRKNIVLSDSEDSEASVSSEESEIKIYPRKQNRMRSESSSDDEVISKRTLRANTKSNKSAKNSKKKRKRITMDSDEDESEQDATDSDDHKDTPSSSKQIRFRRIISKNKLAKTTIDAEKAEKERKERLKAKQLEYNGVVMSQNENTGEIALCVPNLSVPMIKSFTLDLDKKCEKDPCPLTIHPSLVRVLKPHQADGIKFIYECIFESLDRLKEPGGGGILAHCMGLGKTLQTITFLHTILMHQKISQHVRKVMIVVPKNVVTNWYREFQKWLFENDPELDTISVVDIGLSKTNDDRLECLRSWYNNDDPSVLIIGYELFQLLTKAPADRSKKAKITRSKPLSKNQKRLEKMKEEFRKYLQDPGPDLIICDEGHKLKSDDTATFKTMAKIKTRRRLCLSGTPLQNNLMEYYTMVSFVKPGLLGTKSEYANRFANIIKRGQTKDASTYEVKIMRRRCYVLFDYLKNVVHRRDYRVLIETIPAKQEYVIFVRLTQKQIDLYNEFLDNFVDRTAYRVLPDYHVFSRIWTHPYQLISREREAELKRIRTGEDLKDFVTEDSDTPESEHSSEDICDDNDDDDIVLLDNKKAENARHSRRQQGEDPDDEERPETPIEYTGWFTKSNIVTEEDKNNFALSNKLMLLIEIIKKSETCGDKLLVFSQSLESLRLIRRMLEYLAKNDLWFVDGHEALKMEDEEWGWEQGLDYLVIDGSVQNRDIIQDSFNDLLNLRARLMLVSTKAGSLGTNLVSANRVVIFDACWNPSHDTQALFRVYRYGQTKPVYIYRLIAQGTMEERIYKRQVTKESTAKRVTEEAQIQRHFSGHDLDELYEFTPVLYQLNDNNSQTPRMIPPKDRILGEIIKRNEPAIVEYYQHDSLFDEVEDEKLTDKEREEAWEEYGIEKSGRVKVALLPRDPFDTVNDPLYMKCYELPGMTPEYAFRFVFIKKCLDQLFGAIPVDMRNDLASFDEYFEKIIGDSIRKNSSPFTMCEFAYKSFVTTVNFSKQFPGCRSVLFNLKRLSPILFRNINLN